MDLNAVIHVIILAQGSQKRLPGLGYPKQLIVLPKCVMQGVSGRTTATIIDRTIAMVQHISNRDNCKAKITVVCEEEIREHLQPGVMRASMSRIRTAGQIEYSYAPPRADGVSCMSLDHPGNSSLKGAGKVLSSRWEFWKHGDAERRWLPFSPWPAAQNAGLTVILLGDVIYSWTCLQALLQPYPALPHLFIGTSDLGPSTGEIWGIRWSVDGNLAMNDALVAAVLSHPPFADYQPGQLRRWLFQLDGKTPPWSNYIAVDDYTKDIDLPEHLGLVAGISELAAIDDDRHGLAYGAPC